MPHISVASPLGPLTVFEEAGALVALDFGRAPDGEGSALLDEARAQLAAYFDGELTRFSLPLATRGSDFERRVWSAMEDIPYGATKTYGELAAEVGGTARAVGGACARNPLPIIVPCHRVVGAGGRMTGYSGGEGVETKLLLLRLEGASLI